MIPVAAKDSGEVCPNNQRRFPRFHLTTSISFYPDHNTTMTSLPLVQFFSQMKLMPNMTITVDNALSPSTCCTGATLSSMSRTTPTRKETSRRWSSQSDCSKNMPSIPMRTHDQRWDICPRTTKAVILDVAPSKSQRSEDRCPINFSLPCPPNLYSKSCVDGIIPKQGGVAANKCRSNPRKVQVYARTA
jgi:hypothetical protein